MSSSEEEPYADSGSEWKPSDPDVPGPSNRKKERRTFTSFDFNLYKEDIPNQKKKEKGRKRVRNKTMWKRNIVKDRKVRGEEYIRNGSKETGVCKAFYCLHGVTKHRVPLIAKNLASGHIMSPEDRRGRHSNRPNRIPEGILAQIDERIRSFTRRQSHYTRHDNDNKYFYHLS
nr:unnamed protein product [Callosobruchus analis]